MIKVKEEIELLRKSFELKNKRWATRCLDTIEEKLEKQSKMIKIMIKKMSEKMMCDFIETTNAECANTDCEECLEKYFEKEIEGE